MPTDYQMRRTAAQLARPQRDRLIARQLASGEATQAELAERYLVTRERIRQIAKAAAKGR